MSDQKKPKDQHTGTSQEAGLTLREKIREPQSFSVIMHNDDFTPMDFVVQMLEIHFNKDPATAEAIMLKVHHDGLAVCGVYPFEIAETKVALVMESAKHRGHPLFCEYRPA